MPHTNHIQTNSYGDSTDLINLQIRPNGNNRFCTLSSEKDAIHSRNAQILRRHLEITAAEASIVAHFLADPNLSSIAKERSTSYETIRQQFKSAMQKTATHSQAALALLAERTILRHSSNQMKATQITSADLAPTPDRSAAPHTLPPSSVKCFT